MQMRSFGCCASFAPEGHPWRCWYCYDLTYATRQAAARYRLILKARKVRERLGANWPSSMRSPPSRKACTGDGMDPIFVSKSAML